MFKKPMTPQKYDEKKERYSAAVQARNREIRRLHREEGKGVLELARIYGVDKALISRIVNSEEDD